MPTALELTREEWQPYIEAARQRQALPRPTPKEQREREQLLDRVHEVSTALKTRFGVQRVILFGSLANPEWFILDSDIDIAVEGLAVDDFWQAWQLAEEIISDRAVDLVEIEIAKESLRQAIQRYGLEL